MRKPLVAGNWKMNGSRAKINVLVKGLIDGMKKVGDVDVLLCPPYVYIPAVEQLIHGSDILLGAQDVAKEEVGAFTGEVSVSMLKDSDCSYVIIGHSERRAYYGDTDEIIAKKFAAAIEGGVTPILCVGELLEEREAGVTEEVVSKQLHAVLDHVGVKAFEKAVIAYEPVWAIGTGLTATPAQAQDVHASIRALIAKEDEAAAQKIRILYGGSVKAANAKDIFSQPDIDGGLIGGASLAADEFIHICEAAG